MALSLNAVTLANPVQVVSDTEPVTAYNTVYVGVTTYDLTTLDARKFVHVIQFQWQGLSATELADIRTAWRAACEDYVTLSMDGLRLIGGGSVSDNEMPVMVQEQTALDISYDQGWNSAGDGPVLYAATATFVSEPQVDS